MDLVLVNDAEDELNMGSSLNVEGPLMRTDAAGLPKEAQENHATLLRTMEDAGFVNYPHEWWHFSYGDRYWPFTTGEPAAPHGAV